MKNYLVTTAISYPNGAPHLGHAYEAIIADVFARHKRLIGDNVIFSTGTDEHGLKIAKAAAQAGISPQAYVDATTQPFIALAASLGLSEHVFVRTSSVQHRIQAKALWQRLDKDDIYLDDYSGFYSVRDEAFIPEGELLDSPNGKTTQDGDPVEFITERSYFFRLSRYKEELKQHFASNPDFVIPKARYNEVVNLIEGIRDVSISRTTFKWGIGVPGDPEHVMYVWVDALANYLTAVSDKAPDRWPPDLHVIGKDILRFHAILWPALLISAGLSLPKTILAHGFLKVEGERMSKSVGNGVDPIALVDEFGSDRVRYYLLKSVTLGEDGNFSREELITTSNADLSNALGNLAQRCLKLHLTNDGVREKPFYTPHKDDDVLDEHIDTLCGKVIRALDNHDINLAIRKIWDLVHHTNVYFAEQTPWDNKIPEERRRSVIAVTIGSLTEIARSLQAILPQAAADLWRQLGNGPTERYHGFYEHYLDMPEPTPLFVRIKKD